MNPACCVTPPSVFLHNQVTVIDISPYDGNTTWLFMVGANRLTHHLQDFVG
jgi:hypothetical protein